MTYRLSKRYQFAAAHTLRSSSFSDDENSRVYGPCANASGHGHDYVLELSVDADSLQGDVVWGHGTLDRLVEQHVAPVFAFKNLSETLGANFITSGENLAVTVYQRIAPHLPGALRLTVRVVETEKNSFSYTPA